MNKNGEDPQVITRTDRLESNVKLLKEVLEGVLFITETDGNLLEQHRKRIEQLEDALFNLQITFGGIAIVVTIIYFALK